MLKHSFEFQDNKAIHKIKDKDLTFTGIAICHSNDEDFKSERTGGAIAEARAHIHYLQHKKNCELKSQLKILTHLIANIQNSKNHNPKSYEFARILSQKKAIEREIEAVSQEIAEQKESLKTYIDEKDKLYKRLRAKKDKDNH